LLNSLGVSGLKQAALAVFLLVASSVVLVSCGSNYNGTGTQNQINPATIKVHVFVSNPLFPNGNSTAAVLNVVDGQRDLLSPSVISVGSTSPTPGLLVVFPNKRFTLVFSASNNAVGVVNNVTKAVAQNSGGTAASITLPGATESVVIAPDNVTAFAAVPGATVTGQSPGAVVVMDLNADAVTGAIPVAGARYLAQSHNGNRALVFGSSPNTVTVLTPAAIGTSTDPRLVVCADGSTQTNPALCPASVPAPVFDHPVWAVFSSDDSTAYILNCGPECGGTAASITLLDMNSNLPGPTIPVDAGTIGLLAGNILYVAGTRPGANTCTASSTPTAATTCGEVSAVDVGTMAVTATATITDGYHNRIEMGANNQLFIGAHTCTNIKAPSSGNTPGEVRGCLSIYDTGKSSVVVPPQVGDVTGIQAIARRNVVYVAQNGNLGIYDVTTDKLQTTQVDIIGQAVDVKQID
jgi:hypothetical protein